MFMAIDAAAAQCLPSDDFFLARQPILGRDQRLFAFELLFRSASESQDANVIDHASATAAVISHASQLGMEQVVGAQLAFVNIDAVVLMSDFVRFLAPEKVILEILETVSVTPEVIARVTELKALGFRFALDDVVADSAELRQLLDLVDVIKIDLQAVAPAKLAPLAQALRRPDKKLLAEKVETQEEFRQCLALGFEYFQGYYFARPVILRGKKIAPSELVILHLLDLINSEADNRDIELAIKHDALISLNLLRLVNTPAAYGRGHFDSLAKALIVLGRRQLQRWLQILLYAAPGGTGKLNSPLLQLAVTRGKLLELMTLKVRPARRASADTGFTVGIMSLMDTLFSMPMRDILDTVSVADEVREALLEREGEFGEMLNIVEMLEMARGGKPLALALRHLDLTLKQIREIELAAFEWANELALELH
jgi:EAL and modified HD-GYP domain-containing signal transduction protein